ncbi:MAG: glutamate racemase [Lachnospiraceae bacterium]|jgi:glutamate racemase
MSDKSLPIGVFDSGVGGLTVVKEILHTLPNEKIVYFGDTARVPYGNKSPEIIIRYSKQITKFLVSQNVKAITIACNTASALALEAVRAEVSIPVLGVVEPGARAAARATTGGRIGVIGTTATIASGLYEKYINIFSPDAKVFSAACPLLVNLVEEGLIEDPVTVQMIHRYLDELIRINSIDTLILGCTHYPLLMPVIAREIRAYKANAAAGEPDKITLIDPAFETAHALKALLEESNLCTDSVVASNPDSHRYFVSDDAERFRTFADEILGIRTDNVSTLVLK